MGTITNQTKNTGSLSTGLGFLLTELLGYILQENGGKLILSQSIIKGLGAITGSTKNTGTLTAQSKS